MSFSSVYRFIGVLQQESGKGPRLANGAAYCVPDLTSHTLPPLESIAGAARSVWLPSPAPVRGKIRCVWRAGGVSVPQISPPTADNLKLEQDSCLRTPAGIFTVLLVISQPTKNLAHLFGILRVLLRGSCRAAEGCLLAPFDRYAPHASAEPTMTPPGPR